MSLCSCSCNECLAGIWEPQRVQVSVAAASRPVGLLAGSPDNSTTLLQEASWQVLLAPQQDSQWVPWHPCRWPPGESASSSRESSSVLQCPGGRGFSLASTSGGFLASTGATGSPSLTRSESQPWGQGWVGQGVLPNLFFPLPQALVIAIPVPAIPVFFSS